MHALRGWVQVPCHALPLLMRLSETTGCTEEARLVIGSLHSSVSHKKQRLQRVVDGQESEGLTSIGIHASGWGSKGEGVTSGEKVTLECFICDKLASVSVSGGVQRVKNED